MTNVDINVFTLKMAEDFLKVKPDEMFPCSSEKSFLTSIEYYYKDYLECKNKEGIGEKNWRARNINNKALIKKSMNIKRDSKGRCKLKCANCNSKMIFNQMSSLKIELNNVKNEIKITNDILSKTNEELDDTNDELHETRILLKTKMCDNVKLLNECLILLKKYSSLKTHFNLKHNNIVKTLLNQHFEHELTIFMSCISLLACIPVWGWIVFETTLSVWISLFIYSILSIILIKMSYSTIKHLKLHYYDEEKEIKLASALAAKAALNASKYITLKLITF